MDFDWGLEFGTWIWDLDVGLRTWAIQVSSNDDDSMTYDMSFKNIDCDKYISSFFTVSALREVADILDAGQLRPKFESLFV